MDEVKFVIDGREVVGYKGQTILQVARKYGIFIPALCFDDEVKPYSACRMCLVEVKRGKRVRLVTACDYPVMEGIEVTTENERINRDRKVVLQLLMARCPESEYLKKLALKLGVSEQPRFTKANKECILCGLCVRVCDEVVGLSAIGFESRGFTRKVCTPFDQENPVCIVCGACSMVCPVDIIPVQHENGYRVMSKWHKRSKLIPCPKCGRYYLTEEQLKFFVERANLSEFEASLCPSCR